MKKLLGCILLLGSISAHADIASDIQNVAKKFDLPKTGLGNHSKNGVTISNEKQCYIAINIIDAMDVTAKNFEITVGRKQLGAEIDGWDSNNTTQASSGEQRVFKLEYNTTDNCIAEQKITFSDNRVTFSQTKKCSVETKNRSESMSCKYQKPHGERA